MNKDNIGLFLNVIWLLYFVVSEFRFRSIKAELLIVKEGKIDGDIKEGVMGLTDDELDALLSKELVGEPSKK